MKVTYLQNAGVIIENLGEKILCDPWLVDGCYYGAWHHYPKFDFNPKEFDDIKAQNESDYVVIEDMSKLFDGKPRDEAYFGDYVHYLPRGRDVIAPEIAKTIGHSIDDQIKKSLRLSECLLKP